MAVSIQRPTATIYQFPIGGRLTATRFQKEAALIAAAPHIVYDSWYHDAAIADAHAPSKDKPHS